MAPDERPVALLPEEPDERQEDLEGGVAPDERRQEEPDGHQEELDAHQEELDGHQEGAHQEEPDGHQEEPDGHREGPEEAFEPPVAAEEEPPPERGPLQELLLLPGLPLEALRRVPQHSVRQAFSEGLQPCQNQYS